MHRELVLSILAICSVAAATPSKDTTDLNIKTTGYYIIDGGYINETVDVGLKKWTSEPFGDFIGGLRLTANPTEHFSLAINPELRSHSNFPITPGVATGELKQKMKYDIYMEEGKGTWSFGAPETPFALLDFGLFIYKDNPDTKVFGDYIFRSMIYPTLLFTKFDYAQAQIFGLHASANFLDGNFKNNAFILSDVRNYPYFDISLAYSANYNVMNIVEFGAGINARSIIPVRPSRTTPKGGASQGAGLFDNTYKFAPFQDSTVIHNASGAVLKTISIKPVAGKDSATVTVKDATGNVSVTQVKATGGGISGMATKAQFNPAMSDLTPDAGGAGDLYPELHGTNTHFSFAGTILTGRITLNPMGIFGNNNPLGKDACKIYAEAAVLGLENYPGFYEKRSERIPIMFGANIPTMNYLDFLSIEMEHFGSKEVPSYDTRAYLNLPQPGTHKGEVETLWDDARRTKDDWKWVVAAKKSFKGFGIVGQFGTDHTKMSDEGGGELFDVMSRPSEWYVQVRFVGGVY
jgi:hypothetical protein